MPRVPVWETTAAANNPIPNVRVPTDASLETFGGGSSINQVTGAVRGLSAAAFEIASAEKKKADDLAVTSALNTDAPAVNDLLWNEQTGAFTKKGKDALAIRQTYLEQFDKRVNDSAGALHNEDQRSSYREKMAAKRIDLDSQLQKHTFGEIQKFEIQERSSAVENARNEAVLNYHDPNKVQAAIGEQTRQIDALAPSAGWDPETVKAKKVEALGETHAAIVRRMLSNGSYVAAKRHFEANRESFGDKLVSVEDALREGSLRGESQNQSDQIWSRTRGNLGAALAQAREIEDPNVRKATLDELKTRHSENELVRRTQEENRFKYAASFAEQSKERPDPATWNSLSLNERNAIDSRIKQLRTGTPPVTDWNDFYRLKTMASVEETKNKFLQTNLAEYRPKLADGEFKQLIELQTSLRKKDGKAEETLKGFRTTHQLINDRLSSIGLDPTPKPGSTQAEQVNVFRNKAEDEISRWNKEQGRAPTQIEVRKIIDGLVTEGVVKKGRWFSYFDTKKRAWELEEGEAFIAPDKDRSEIVAALKRRKMPVTEAAINQLYNLKVKRGAQ